MTPARVAWLVYLGIILGLVALVLDKLVHTMNALP